MTMVSSDRVAQVLSEVYDDTYSGEGAEAINNAVHQLSAAFAAEDWGFDVERFQRLCGM